MCDTRFVRRISSICLVAAVLSLSAGGCKKETVVPEDDTWVPDESQEPAAGTPDPAPGLSEDERKDKAKDLYIAAEGKAGEGDWAAALNLYEQAYQLVPGKHGFALKVGVAAEKAGDCAKAITYYEHFLKYAEADKYEDDIASTKKSLGALKKSGC
jgi:tetratricopeptide (TPR) repeat protein